MSGSYNRVLGRLMPLVIAGMVGCDDPQPPAEASDGPEVAAARNAISDEAREFVRVAGLNSLLDVQSSQLALEQGLGGDVQEIARAALVERRQVYEALRAIARQRSIPFPVALDEIRATENERLRGLGGDSLAAAYRALQAELHRENVQFLAEASQSLRDPQLIAWAAHAQPHARQALLSLESMDAP